MKRWEAVLYGMLGAILVAVFAPLAVNALQTYVRPTSGTDHPTEHLTNIDNRDEALRSCFSGTAAPTSPTPVDGQCWLDTTSNTHYRRIGGLWIGIPVLTANTFTGNQSISASTSPQWYAIDTTNAVTARLMANDTEGRFGTSTNHPACVETNGNCRSTWDTSGNLTNTAEIRTTNGDDHTATAACASGYTRVGLWCYDTDELFSILVQNTTNGATNDTTISDSTLGTAGAKAALLRVYCVITQDGTGETAVQNVAVRRVVAGDQTTYDSACHTIAVLANEVNQETNDIIVPLDSNNDFEYEVSVSGTVASRQASIRLIAYLD